MIHMVWALTDKVESTQEQMGSVSRQKESRRKNGTQRPVVRNTLTELESSSDGLMNGAGKAEAQVSRLADRARLTTANVCPGKEPCCREREESGHGLE